MQNRGDLVLQDFHSTGRYAQTLEVELKPTLARACTTVDLAWREVIFTIEEARRALPYIARIVKDAAEAFRQVQRCRLAIDNHAPSKQLQLVDDRRIDAIGRLNAAIDECNAVGVDLLNIPRGLVRFSALINGRRVNLLWQLGDHVEDAWPEWTAAQISSLTPPDAADHNPDSCAAVAGPAAI